VRFGGMVYSVRRTADFERGGGYHKIFLKVVKIVVKI